MNNKKLNNKYKISEVFEIELTILAIVLLLSLAFITLFFGSEICNFLNKLQIVRVFLKLIPKILLGIGILEINSFLYLNPLSPNFPPL